jgi:hypothetical protein
MNGTAMELHGPSAGRIAAPEINTVVRQALTAVPAGHV